MAADASAEHLFAADEAIFQLLEDSLHDAGHTWQDEEVADLKPRRTRDRVRQQHRTLRDHRHAQPRLVQVARRVMGFEQALGLRVHDQQNPEGVGDTLGGDVVMGRTDPTRRKDIVEDTSDLVHGGYDHIGVIRYYPRLTQPYTDLVEPLGEIRQVGVLGAARQDLVADDQDTGGDDPW